ncbi:MAG: hypothetical protein WA130_00105 [Candidatus Methanoperedens sp.]
MDITRIYNYYPEVVLSDLSDAFSEDKMANQNKLCIISYLSKTLRIGDTIKFTNKYVLFLENTSTVTAIAWSYILHNDENSTTDNHSLTARVIKQNEYMLEFGPSLLDVNKDLKFNRLTISCKVTKGIEVIELEIGHAFVKMIGVDTLFSQNMEYKSFIGNPDTTNFLVNYVRDYFPKGAILWNNLPVTLSAPGEESLINYVASLLYYKTLTYFGVSLFDKTYYETYYDVGRHDNPEIEALILSETMGTVFENTNNGICELPLHLLSDMTTDLKFLPDFLNIASTNKIYEMLSRALVFGPDLDNYTLNETESAKLIKESKERLVAQKAIFDGKKLVDLYNLSRFPKSAIRLSAMLFKFLFEASKKNDCKECLNRDIGWKFLTLDGIKTKEDFIKNIYSHYLEGPVNKVLAFRRPAQTCAQYAWSPYIYTILNFLPRITNAYFAKKVVIKKNGNLTCFFKRIDSKYPQKDSTGANLPYDAILGREVYLVIETLDLQGKELICHVKPSTSTMTGNTNKIGLMANNAEVEEHKPIVGQFTALEDNHHSFAHYTNLERDHSDKAFIKLYLRPQSRATFDIWSTNIDTLANKTVNLEIAVQLSSLGEAYFGDKMHGIVGVFLNTDAKEKFRVTIRTFYEVFEKDNEYNYLSDADKRIGKIRNNQSTQVVYYYHDVIGNEHWICECNLFTPRKRANGQNLAATSNVANVPPGYTSDHIAPGGGDAYWNYYYPNGDIVTRDDPAAAGTDYGVIKYPVNSPAVNDIAEIIRMPDSLNLSFKIDAITTVVIKYGFFNTARRYANSGGFGAFLGVLAELSYMNVESTGMCFEDATSYPSISHPNGDSIDSRYLETQVKKRAIIASFIDWGFAQVISGMADPLDGAHLHNAQHNDHLHAGNFPDAKVKVII